MSHAPRTPWFLSRGAGLLCLLLVPGCGHLVILHDPLTAPEHNDLGVSYERQGLTSLAAREYRRALAVDKHYARARINLGNLSASAGKWNEAETCYRRALRDAPSDPDALNNLAIALARQGKRLFEAEALADSAVAKGGERDSLYRATLAEVRAARDKATPRTEDR